MNTLSLPSQQEAIVITAAGDPDVLQPRPVAVPRPRADEVLVRVQAAGINRHDCNQRRRGPTPHQSDVPGLEVAGIVAAVGERVARWRVGDAVCALVDGGGYARYAIAQAGQVLPRPAGLDAVEAASLPEAAFTTWHNFFGIAALGPGRPVLVHGGTSGVGVIALQALSALGHPVLATCGSPDKLERARQLGALQAFDYRADDFATGVLAATRGRGVDVVLDMSGGRHALQNLRALAHGGAIIHLSAAPEARFDAPLRLIMEKQARVTGSLLRPLPDADKARVARELEQVLWPLVESRVVRPQVHATFPLAQAAEAHRRMELGQHAGKLVLDLGD
jgi:putative PIG3 family NAD(P)H quinone oxidoreductase